MPTKKEEMRSLAQGIVASFETRIAGVNHIRESSQALLQELDQRHNAMVKQLRADLQQAEGQREREARVEIGQRKRDVSAWLKEYDEDHAAMGRELRADLAKVEPALHQAEGQREREARQQMAHRKFEVNSQLQGYDQTHGAMAWQLRADLSQVPSALHQAEAQREREARQEIAHRRRDVNAQLKGYRNEQVGARQEWRKLAVTMGSKRNGAAVTEDMAALSDRVFQYLANHPDGARLAELEREFGLGRLQAGRVVRHLMDEGKAEKRDLSYFAT